MSDRVWWGWKYVIWIAFAVAVLVFFAMPLTTTYLVRDSKLGSTGNVKLLLQIERTMAQGMLLFVVAWVVFLGGTFASFLNVVAWRVPRGKSILGSSRCPTCNSRLTFKDNLPFWGWLKNWGHCSTCDAPFSPRYFFAELILGAIFLIVSATYLLSGGATLPFRERTPWTLLNRMLLEPDTDLVLIVVVHLVALTSLFTFALIEFGRFTIPTSVFVAGALLLVLAVVWPGSMLVAWTFPIVVPGELRLMSGWVASLLGIGFGYLLGSWYDNRSEQQELARTISGVGSEFDLIEPHAVRDGKVESRLRFGLAIVGLALGWQSVLIVFAFWYVLSLLFKLNRPALLEKNGVRLVNVHSLLLVAALLHLATWKWFEL